MTTPRAARDGRRQRDAGLVLRSFAGRGRRRGRSRPRRSSPHGATILDVGGESTRPGAAAVPEDVELARVVPVVGRPGTGWPGSRSTRSSPPSPARRSGRGATLLNDVSGTLAPLAAELGVGWVAMHHRGIPAGPADAPMGPSVSRRRRRPRPRRRPRGSGRSGWRRSTSTRASASGRTRRTTSLCSRASTSCATRRTHEGFGVLVGASRKRFLGALPHGAHARRPRTDSRARSPSRCYAMVCGADVVRVHDVAATAQAASLVSDGEAA